jgi:DNA-directed RNA polymerase subunit RPC12/RpoP
MGRIAVSKRVRFEIFKRDRFSCQYCGSVPPHVVLHVDHIHPVVDGGSNDPDNLVTACDACNLGKGPRLLSAVPESLAAKASRIAEAEEQLRGFQEIMRAKANRLEHETWEIAEMLWPGSAQSGANKVDLASIRRFLDRLAFPEVYEFALLATRRKPYGGKTMWLYFCGCCWRRIRELEGGRT